ncbi:hypothetical protein [Candidatus Formimonas warabiya]|uniref:Uncharacterized protein n=1 Tax=Formimonas warabiya TaxID=1761012 RepID=A0A3G1KPT1_FORW1|nr:hypothetical protein [Candidatus Formimonas warabiya]ATW24472.1 hypothetical protein DCMF_06485 [Candidatus Formimonas warabiya]
MPEYLLIIIIYMFSVAILALVMKIFFGKIIDKMMELSKMIATFLSNHIKNKRSVYIIEIIFFLLSVVNVYISFRVNTNLKMIVLIISVFIIFIFGELIFILRNREESFSSIIDKLFAIYKKYKNLYSVKRLVLLFKQGYSLYFMFIVLVVIFQIAVIPDLPAVFYFYLFFTLPIAVNIWIYFVYGRKKRNTLDIDMRRVICYITVFIILFCDGRAKFFDYIDDGVLSTSVSTLMVSIDTVLFLGIDRFLKIIIDDFERYHSV